MFEKEWIKKNWIIFLVILLAFVLSLAASDVDLSQLNLTNDNSTKTIKWMSYGANSTYATIYTFLPNFTMTLSASSTYVFNCRFLTSSVIATTGEQLRVNFTGSPSAVNMTFTSLQSATTIGSLPNSSTTTNTFPDSGSAGVNILSPTDLDGFITTGGSTVTALFEFKSEVAGSNVVWQKGSKCEWEKVI